MCMRRRSLQSDKGLEMKIQISELRICWNWSLIVGVCPFPYIHGADVFLERTAAAARHTAAQMTLVRIDTYDDGGI